MLNTPEEVKLNDSVVLEPTGLPMKSWLGIVMLDPHDVSEARGAEAEIEGGQDSVWLNVFSTLTDPGGSGLPGDGLGPAAATGANGIKNKKFGNKSSGISTVGASFRTDSDCS